MLLFKFVTAKIGIYFGLFNLNDEIFFNLISITFVTIKKCVSDNNFLHDYHA